MSNEKLLKQLLLDMAQQNGGYFEASIKVNPAFKQVILTTKRLINKDSDGSMYREQRTEL